MIDEIEDFKREAAEQDRQDQLHENRMRIDIDYFLEHSQFNELKETYDKLHKKMWDYGWLTAPKDYL